MKRLLAALALIAALFGVRPAEASRVTTVYGPAGSATGATTAVATSDAAYIRVHGWRTDSASAGVCTIYVQVSTDGTAWYNAATFTNLTGLDATTGAGGDAITVPAHSWMRLFVVGPLTGTFTVKTEIKR